MTATVRPATAEELLRMPHDGFRYELVRGVLRRMMPAGNQHGKLAMKIGPIFFSMLSKTISALSMLPRPALGFPAILILSVPLTLRLSVLGESKKSGSRRAIGLEPLIWQLK